MKKILLLLGLFWIGTMLFACATNAVPEEKPTAPEALTQVTAKESWEIKWETTLKEARTERKVVAMASSQAPALQEAVPILKKKYGIDLEIIAGRAADLGPKIVTEYQHGLYMTDVFFSGLNTAYGFKSKYDLWSPMEQALILPEVVNPRAWYGEKIPWGDKERMVFDFVAYPSTDLAINTDLVKPGEVNSWYDLLEPRWKSKLLANDPTITGTAFNTFSSFLVGKVLNLDYFRQLVNQGLDIQRDARLQVEWLARGKYPLLVFVRTGEVQRLRDAGVTNIGLLVPKEGRTLSGTGMVLVKKAPHPNAAKIFINWFLSKEGQIIQQKIVGKQSARVDTGTEWLAPEETRDPGGKYIKSANTIEEWVMNEQEKYLELARQIFVVR